MILVSTLFFCSCDKAKKNEWNPHNLNGDVYSGMVYDVPVKISFEDSIAKVQIVQVEDEESYVIKITTTRYGLAQQKGDEPGKTFIVFNLDGLENQNGEKAWLPLYVTIKITGKDANKIRKINKAFANTIEDEEEKQKYIDIINGKTVAIYEYNEMLWDYIVPVEDLVIEKNDDEKTFTHIIERD